MLEVLLGTGSGGTYTFPDSGPGPKTLAKGDPTLGYFGLVPSSEFFTRQEVQDGVGVTGGSALNQAPQWIKFMMDRKVLFVPLNPIMVGISWNALYNAGAIYGDGTNGRFPVGAGVKQDCVLLKWGRVFKVRVFQGDGIDPTSAPGQVANMTGGEQLRFMAALYNSNYAGWTGPSWKLFSTPNLGAAYMSWTKGTYTSSTGYCNTAGPVSATISVKTDTSTVTWLPVLELDDDTSRLFALTITGPGFNILDVLSPVQYTSIEAISSGTSALVPIARSSMSFTSDAVNAPYITELTPLPPTLSQISQKDISQPGLLPMMAITGTVL